ncbi:MULTISPECIES: XdhC family protein [Tenacibaculum]|uniref:XdhC family protein n=1 Tax=Tenacibaculum TaxID=104267 RepID=UPI001F0AF18B|nr:MULTISPECIES: XdhC/CoxI family protein [Tenacibaculum]MCH3882372.1 XdhC family protein [Tenacibaculum aquimarinum]MDO6600158.1 XdhC family protein [Tenacibaculum sp. 1_MG-2023]
MIFWQHILNKLKDNQKIYVLTVIENHGSSPGRKGFKMLVAEDGFIFGSIGGGVMEFSLVEEAQQLLILENSPTFIKKQIHKGNIKDGSGMICSGEQTVAFHCLDNKHISVVKDILNCLKNSEKGALSLTPSSFHFSHKVLENRFDYTITSTTNWHFEEHIGSKETLYIVGGGHVGVAVSELFVKLGFYVVIFDNRENLNTLENNTFANKKLVVNYEEIDNYITKGNTSYVAIMTNKYTDDKLVLSKLLKNHYKFLGVLGSNAKLKTMWEVLLKEGFTQEELNTVYAPIGISIKSETVEEIAVSIAAQIIQIKNSEK